MKLDLQKELTEALEINEVFGFNIGSFKVSVDESTVVSWIIIAVMTLIAILLTRNLKVQGEITKRQAFLELCYEKSENFFKGLMGEKVQKFIPWLMSVALFIGISNTIGLLAEPFNFKPPTKSMQMTAALAITSIIIVEYAAYKGKGVGGRLKQFANPINIMEVFTKPLSLCMRLFGNVLAAFTIMELIKIVTRHIFVPIIPVAFSLYFDIFDGLLQAYIFVFLTALYLEEASEPVKKKDKKKKKNKAEQTA
ncbi:MAG: F0F1 ATP synthase subunit A [Ruminococcaceae bacterium]|nr:F0F1 ATP synthase subunit A [Oscillospiraceae bacterium]